MTNEQKQQIIKLRQDGYGYATIASSLGLTKNQVSAFCRRSNLAGTELLPQLWQTSDADTGPKACEILLRCLPHPLVEHPSGQGQPQSLLFLYLRLLREAIHSLWK